eukprot:3199910-Amphidinium_carterae.1
MVVEMYNDVVSIQKHVIVADSVIEASAVVRVKKIELSLEFAVALLAGDPVVDGKVVGVVKVKVV